MSSGVAVDPKIVTAFQGLVKERKFRAAVFKINDEMTAVQLDKTLPTEETGQSKADWTAFTKGLPDNDCRYAAYDFKYEHQGALKTKIIFLLWSPEYSKVRSKMIYASSQEGVVQKLEGIQRQLQVTDRDDLEYESISKQLAAMTAGY
jgi:cofilin